MNIKSIEIKAKGFFALLKEREQSMWSVFAEMLNEKEEQLVIFIDEEEKELAHYILPKSLDQLKQDQKLFAENFKEKLKSVLD